jgi:hypothetical protein
MEDGPDDAPLSRKFGCGTLCSHSRFYVTHIRTVQPGEAALVQFDGSLCDCLQLFMDDLGLFDDDITDFEGLSWN